jgi:Domain of unknown function (DUF4276)
MEYLGLALFAEGPTDHRFLRPLLLRLCEDLCAHHAPRPVEVTEVLSLHSLSGTEGLPRERRIADAAREAHGAWRVLFVHADGEGDPQAARRQRVQPGLDQLAADMAGRRAGIAVVPVRETEAWVLADGNALRRAFGTTLNDARLGLPRSPRQVEQLRDPKQTLNAAYAAISLRGRRAGYGPASFLQLLGEQVALNALRAVPSFAQMESDLLQVLRRWNIAS